MSIILPAYRFETALPVTVQVNNASGGVKGLTVVVACRDGGTVNSWLDFNDSTFKTSGWTTQQSSMTEVSTSIAAGVYAIAAGLDLNAMTNLPAATNKLILEYEITAGGTSGNAIDVIDISEVGLIFDHDETRKEVNDATGDLEHYKRDNATVRQRWPLKTKNDVAPTVQAGVQTKRKAPTL